MSIRGFREVEDQLQKLGSKDGTRILRRAMFLAGAPIEEQAKRNAGRLSRGSGSLKQSIGKRVFVNNRSDNSIPDLASSGGARFRVTIFPVKGNRVSVALHNLFYKRRRKGIFHGHFAEWGTKFAKATPVFGPALRSRSSHAVAIFTKEVRSGIERQLKRNARNARKALKSK